MWILLFTTVLGIAICLSVAAILLNPISEEGSLDRRIKHCGFAPDAHNSSRAGSLDVQAKGVRRIKTSDDVRLLLRRMAVLDVVPDQVNSADPLLFRELQGRCSLCPSRATCACDLAQDAADGKRPANHASHIAIIYENVCPLTGKLMGTHDDGYCSAWS